MQLPWINAAAYDTRAVENTFTAQEMGNRNVSLQSVRTLHVCTISLQKQPTASTSDATC